MRPFINKSSIIINNSVVSISHKNELCIIPLDLYAKYNIDCSILPHKTFGTRFADNKILNSLAQGLMQYNEIQ
jgi:hypothetical protein